MRALGGGFCGVAEYLRHEPFILASIQHVLDEEK